MTNNTHSTHFSKLLIIFTTLTIFAGASLAAVSSGTLTLDDSTVQSSDSFSGTFQVDDTTTDVHLVVETNSDNTYQSGSETTTTVSASALDNTETDISFSGLSVPSGASGQVEVDAFQQSTAPTDESSYNANDTTTATVDDSSPTASISNPSNNAEVSSQGTIEGDSSDTETSVSSVSLTIEDSSGDTWDDSQSAFTTSSTSVEVATSGGAWSYSNVPTSDGTYDLQATATDAAGNTGSSSTVTYTIDTQAPSTSVTVPSSDVQPTETISVDYDLTDDVSIQSATMTLTDSDGDTDQIQKTFTGDLTTGTGNSVSFDLTQLTDGQAAEGSYTVTFDATDAAGNSASQVSDSSNVDGTSPSISSAVVTGTSEVTLTFDEGVYANGDETGTLGTGDFSYNDANSEGASGISTVSHSSAGGSTVTITLSSEVDNSDLSTDDIQVNADSVYDQAGNAVSSTSTTYTDGGTDDVNPSVSSFSATESGSDVRVSLTVDEQLSSIDVGIDGSTLTETDFSTSDDSAPYTYTATYTPGSDGTYTATLSSISDGSNTVSSFSVSSSSDATVDTTGPTFGTVTSPSSPTDNNQPTVSIDSVTDSLNNVDETTIQVDLIDSSGNTDVTYTGTGTLTYSGNTVSLDLSTSGDTLTDDTYDVQISASDDDESANPNSNTYSSAFTVDTQIDNAAINSPTAASPVVRKSGETVTVDYDAQDSNFDTATVKINNGPDSEIASTTVSAGESTVDLSIPGSTTDGSYDVVLTVDDTAGNSKTVTEADAVQVNDTVSSVSVTDDPTQSSNTAFTVTGTADNTQDVSFKINDSDGDSAMVTKTISSTSFSADIDLSSLTFDGGNGDGLSEGAANVYAEQASSFSSPEASTSFTVDDTPPTGTIDSITPSPITDSETGDTNEATVTVTFDEDMEQTAGDVTVTPDVNSELTTAPSVENKRWEGSQTFKVDLQFTDDDEDVTGVTLEVAGAQDLAGNSMSAETQSYDVETKNPSTTGATTYDSDGDGDADSAKVTFSEDIDESAITPGDWSIGGQAVEEVNYGASEDDSTTLLNITTDANEADGTDAKEVTYSGSSVEDTVGNQLPNQDTSAISETDRAAPVLLTGDAATTTSGDGNGNTDTMTLKYSEDISGSSTSTSDYTVEDALSGDQIDLSSVGVTGDTITLNLDTTDANQTTDQLQLTTSNSPVTDGSFTASSETETAITDGAKPVASVAIGPGTIAEEDTGEEKSVAIDFSEEISTAPTVEVLDLASSPYSVTETSFNSGTGWAGEVSFNDDNEEVASARIEISGAQDDSGNTMNADDSYTIEVDTIAPSVTSVDPADPLSEIVDLTDGDYSISNDDGGITTVKYSEDGGSTYTEISNPASFDTTAVSDGSIRVKVNDTDDVGNYGFKVGSTTVDNSAPTFNVKEGTESGPVSSDDIKVAVYEPVTSLSSTDYALSSDSTCDASDTYSNSFTNDTTFTISTTTTDDLCVKAVDQAGNTDYKNVGTLNVDSTKPTVSSVETFDSDKNGDIDGLRVSYSEDMKDSTVGSDDISVSGKTISSASETSDGVVEYEFQDQGEGTSSTPTASFNEANIQDVAGNQLATTADTTASDGAAPVMMYAKINHGQSDSSGTHVKFKFSESVSDDGANSDGVWIDGKASDLGGTPADTHTVDYGEVLDTADSPLVNLSSEVVDSVGNSAVNLSGQSVEVDTFRKDIVSGWNYVSFPIGDRNSVSISSVLDTSKVDSVWKYMDGEWKSYDPDASSNPFTKFEGGVGYQIKANSGFTLDPNVNNTDAGASGGSVPTDSVELENGWNLIGQWQEYDQVADNGAEQAFDGISSTYLDQVVGQDSSGSAGVDFSTPFRASDGTTDGKMQTGDAYWMWSSASSSIQYRIN